MEYKDVYICYNGADLDWVRDMAEQLESETIDGLPSSRQLTVFFDKWDIAPGQSLIDRMNTGMASSRHVVVVLSPEFLKADWPRFEWKHIVAQNPNNIGERIIPLFLRELSLDRASRIEFCAPFLDLRYIDFRKHSDFKRNFNELVRRVRNLPPERGRKLPPIAAREPVFPVVQPEMSWMPDKVSDLLLSNLLTVRGLPQTIWSGTTEHRKNKEVWDVVSEAEPFILRDGRLFTFANLKSNKTALRNAVNNSTITSESYYDWLLRDDRKTWLMDLFNTCLKQHLRRKHILKDEKGRYYFTPNANGTDRVWDVRIGRPRTVTAKKGEGLDAFWVHYAARMKFRRLGEALFLSIEPIFLFTTDGYASVKGKNAGKLSLQWGGKQQNPDILRNLLFWANVLSGGHQTIELSTGSESIILDAMPATSRLDQGIAFDTIKIRALLEQVDTSLNDVAESKEVEEDDQSETDQEGKNE